MGVKIAYKQEIEHINENPLDFSNIKRIAQVTKLHSTYYNKNLPKTSDIEEFLKRNKRYTFTVFNKNVNPWALPYHVYIYDNEEIATIQYKKVMCEWINQQLQPYRKLVKKGCTLTSQQIEKCKQIQDLLPED